MTPHEQLVERLADRFRTERECHEQRTADCDACDSNDPNACTNMARLAFLEIAAAGLRIVPARADAKMVDAGLAATAAWKGIAGSALTVNEEKMRLRYAAAVAAAPDYLGAKE